MRIRLHEGEAKGSETKYAQINHCYRTCSNTTRRGGDDRVHIMKLSNEGTAVFIIYTRNQGTAPNTGFCDVLLRVTMKCTSTRSFATNGADKCPQSRGSRFGRVVPQFVVLRVQRELETC